MDVVTPVVVGGGAALVVGTVGSAGSTGSVGAGGTVVGGAGVVWPHAGAAAPSARAPATAASMTARRGRRMKRQSVAAAGRRAALCGAGCGGGKIRAVLRIGVVGCGTGGPAAALALARAGHDVEVLEQAPDPGPVGAGILLQPTGMAVLRDLGLLDEVLAHGARVERLRGTTTAGRTVLDLAYADLRPGLFGLGIHRGSLFAALRAALDAQHVPVRCGVAINGLRRHADRTVTLTSTEADHGPYDLVIAADGARSAVRRAIGVRGRVARYRVGRALGDPRGRRRPT